MHGRGGRGGEVADDVGEASFRIQTPAAGAGYDGVTKQVATQMENMLRKQMFRKLLPGLEMRNCKVVRKLEDVIHERRDGHRLLLVVTAEVP